MSLHNLSRHDLDDLFAVVAMARASYILLQGTPELWLIERTTALLDRLEAERRGKPTEHGEA